MGSKYFSPEDWKYALEHAYVPEHIPGLMTQVSKAEPFQIDEYLGYRGSHWLILVGYPLRGEFNPERVEQVISRVKEEFQPEYLWFIGPQIPPSLSERHQQRSSDFYYRLLLEDHQPKTALRRTIEKTSHLLTLHDENEFGKDHQRLTKEFLKSKPVPALVAELYRSMPEYLSSTESGRLLTARDLQGRLSAFFVIETAPPTFDTYVLSCFSRKHYVPHASDFLFAAMIDRAKKQGKSSINLGLGVNDGIRRFKQKWGGKPWLAYEYCECYFGPPKTLSMIDHWLSEGL